MLSPTDLQGLPRPYPFWKDWAFWCFVIWFLPYFYWSYWFFRLLSLNWKDDLALVLFLTLTFGYPLLLIGIARDTYRWSVPNRSEEHTSELQSPYVISYAVVCFKKNSRAPDRTRLPTHGLAQRHTMHPTAR